MSQKILIKLAVTQWGPCQGPHCENYGFMPWRSKNLGRLFCNECASKIAQLKDVAIKREPPLPSLPQICEHLPTLDDLYETWGDRILDVINRYPRNHPAKLKRGCSDRTIVRDLNKVWQPIDGYDVAACLKKLRQQRLVEFERLRNYDPGRRAGKFRYYPLTNAILVQHNQQG